MSDWVSHSYGLLGCAILVLAFASFWLQRRVGAVRVRWGLLTTIFVISWIPFAGTSPVVFLRGIVGDIAIPTFFLCGMMVVGAVLPSTRTGPLDQSQPRPPFLVSNASLVSFFVVVVGVGLVFYPMTLGFALLDPYAWGFTPHVMILVCLGLVLAWELAGRRTPATLILLSVAAYAVRLLESSNLWDYLMDPILFGISLVMLGDLVLRSLRGSRRSCEPR